MSRPQVRLVIDPTCKVTAPSLADVGEPEEVAASTGDCAAYVETALQRQVTSMIRLHGD